MKKVIFILAFVLMSGFSFANEQDKTFTENEIAINATNNNEDCVITKVVEIQVNGETVFAEGTILRIEGMSCDEFFTALSQIFF